MPPHDDRGRGEGFGLASCINFAGRVGRGTHKSYCFLFSDDPAAATNPRLQAISENAMALTLAEKDLQIAAPAICMAPDKAAMIFKNRNT